MRRSNVVITLQSSDSPACMKQERSHLAVAGEAVTRAKLKRRELQTRQGDLREVVDEEQPRLAALLETGGAGELRPAPLLSMMPSIGEVVPVLCQ